MYPQHSPQHSPQHTCTLRVALCAHHTLTSASEPMYAMPTDVSTLPMLFATNCPALLNTIMKNGSAT